MSQFEPNAFAFNPANAARFTSLSLTRIKALLRSGKLPKHKDGKRTLVLRSDLEAYMLSLGTQTPRQARGEHGRFVRH
ncbi:MAG TPA: helix-turn-helix domain-containing protein [Xanthobacteraceae bacterium]